MSRNLLRFLSVLGLGVCVQAAIAQQRPADLQPLPEPPPPPPGLVDPALEPQVTIRRQGEDKVEEYRIRGRLYMIKVTPPHGRPYYLIDRKGTGNFVQEETAVGDKGIAVPLWVIHSF
ncbi:MAG: DUF2782 domain-containing protein [Sulfuritalea sp.]|nr:DUF2782 domain-containing protein [Sulfuritalea sp.]